MTPTSTSPSSTPAASSTASTWTIDQSHTLVEISAKHMMFTTVKGRLAGVQGTIVTDENDPTRSSVDVVIDASTIDTRDEKRDAHLRSADFLDVDNHPSITFRGTRVEKNGNDRLRVYGDLTIRGVTREVVLDTELNGQGKSPFGMTVAGFTARTSINRSDFGLNWNVALETGGLLVSDTLKVLLEVQAIKQQ